MTRSYLNPPNLRGTLFPQKSLRQHIKCSSRSVNYNNLEQFFNPNLEIDRMERRRIPFARFVSGAFEGADYSTDDTLALLLPLFRKVHQLHETGLVAPFEKEGALFFSDGILDIDETLAHPPI